MVSLQVQTKKSWTSADQIWKSLGTLISNFIEPKINVLDVNCKLIQGWAKCDEVLICNSLVEIVFVIALCSTLYQFAIYIEDIDLRFNEITDEGA